MDTPTPVSPKVTVAVFAGALVTLIVWGVDITTTVDLPVLVQGALTTLIMAIAAFIRPDPLRTAGAAAVAASPETRVGEIQAVTEQQ